MKCPLCNGAGVRLGSLGRKQWFRCRNCGMVFSKGEKHGSVQ